MIHLKLILRCFILSTFSLLSFSCYYVVKIDSLKKADIDKHKKICLFVPKNDLLLYNEDLERKLLKLLKHKGFIVSDCKNVSYMLISTFKAKKSSYTYTTYIPFFEHKSIQFSFGGYLYNSYNYTNSYNVYGYSTGSETSVKYKPLVKTETIFHRGISLLMIDLEKSRAKNKIVPIWMCNVISSGYSNDFRKVINFMLVPINEYFLKDTNGQKVYELSEYNSSFRELQKILGKQ